MGIIIFILFFILPIGIAKTLPISFSNSPSNTTKHLILKPKK